MTPRLLGILLILALCAGSVSCALKSTKLDDKGLTSLDISILSRSAEAQSGYTGPLGTVGYSDRNRDETGAAKAVINSQNLRASLSGAKSIIRTVK